MPTPAYTSSTSWAYNTTTVTFPTTTAGTLITYPNSTLWGSTTSTTSTIWLDQAQLLRGVQAYWNQPTYVERIGEWARRPPAEPTLEQQARAAARERAEELLLSLLTPAQRQDYEEHGYIVGLTNRGNPYRIFTGRGISGNVELTRDGRVLTLCAHPPAHLPHCDLLVGQKLALDTDEEHFVRTANVHRTRAAA